MKVITTRLISSKKIKTAMTLNLRKSIKRQSTKVFQTDDQRLFDVYNLGTASTLRVEGIDIAGKKQVRKILPNWRKRVQLKDHSIILAPKDNPKPSPF
jgi:penicillin-binding protein 2